MHARPFRITVTLALAALLAGHVAFRRADAAPRTGPYPFALDRPIKVDVRSSPVNWRGSTYHLVGIGRVTFHLDGGHLTAVAPAGVTTFDQVTYDVHGAVFGRDGALLGTARAVCPVERLWVGKVMLESRELKLDFGVSEAYQDAKTFTLAITRRKVLTPDDWQKK